MVNDVLGRGENIAVGRSDATTDRADRPRPRAWRRIAVATPVTAVLVFVGCSGSEQSSDTTTAVVTSPPTTGLPATTQLTADQTAPNGVNGIKVAADGSLWVASLNSDVVLNVDPETGAILRRVAAPAGSGPDDVALAEDGTVYWTGFTSGDVGAILIEDEATAAMANVGPGANPIAIRSDGTLLVGRAITATGLFSIDPSGDPTPVALADPGNLNSFDITPDGAMYAPSLTDTSIIEVDPASGERVRSVATLDGAPIAARWHDGNLFVLVISDGAQVVRVSPSDGATQPVGATGLAVADNLAVADDGTIFVTGLNEPTITVMSADGAIQRTMRVGAG